jgi:apolipoprotein N-acyltransferase
MPGSLLYYPCREGGKRMRLLANLLIMAVGTVCWWVGIALIFAGIWVAANPILVAIGLAFLAAPVVAAEVWSKARENMR